MSVANALQVFRISKQKGTLTVSEPTVDFPKVSVSSCNSSSLCVCVCVCVCVCDGGSRFDHDSELCFAPPPPLSLYLPLRAELLLSFLLELRPLASMS